ncbi:hypothetical protein KGF57_003197 [Candida theae]|uniref:Chromatin structure-remodeling complex protein RSC58 n=1 Tax=Candida theae TaxID=1198502 RepID=A0AAD5FY66_9ASCO|nr:uncharacterized protein KGF57_003197 [Candida theae]KAI5957503.1 hypothetical protein KGF57_003197 [Candida theae]
MTQDYENGGSTGTLQATLKSTNIEVLTTFKAHFNAILPDLFTVYQHTNGDIISKEVLPENFYEPDPDAIISSLKEKDSKVFTSLSRQYEEGKYNSSPYRLYHDIKAVSSVLLSKESQGSEAYKQIDFFYKFSCELLLREMGTIVQTNQSNDITNELETQLEDEFNKILDTYTLANGEVITYISKSREEDYQSRSSIYNPHHPPPIKQKIQPLFSSIIQKSSLDSTPTLVDEPFTVTKVVPMVKDSNSNNLLENISPSSATIPLPLQGPTNILHDFFHPTWYTVAMPDWLTYKALSLRSTVELPQYADLPYTSNEPPMLNILRNHNNEKGGANNTWGSGHNYQSFAPNKDGKGAVVSERLKGNIWLQHIGVAEIEKLKHSFVHADDAMDEDTEVEDVERTQGEIATPSGTRDDNDVEVEDAEDPTTEIKKDDGDLKEQHEISLTNLIKWDPQEIKSLEFLKDHQQDLLQPSKLQRLISDSLLEINKLRQERYAKDLSCPSDEENQLHKRVHHLLSITMKLYNVGPGSLGYKVSKKIPTLVSEYNGTLPGMPASRSLIGSGSHLGTSHITKPGRLPNLRTSSTRGRRRLQ